MECKDSPGFELGQDTRVLIETLWNVKLALAGAIVGLVDVLIETLWNVKTTANTSVQSSALY